MPSSRTNAAPGIPATAIAANLHPQELKVRRRPLGIPTMLDRAMQALWLMALIPGGRNDSRSELLWFSTKTIDRRTPSNKLYVRSLNAILRNGFSKVIFEACFDNISHDWLLETCRWIRQFCANGCMQDSWTQGVLFPTEAGTPQGGIASPALANLALDGLEDAVYTAWRPNKTSRRACQGACHPLCGRLHRDRRLIGRC